MDRTQAENRGFGELLSRAPGEYTGYGVLDPVGQKVGRAEKLFFDGNGGPEYVRVRIGRFFSKLIPVQDAALDGAARSLTLR